MSMVILDILGCLLIKSLKMFSLQDGFFAFLNANAMRVNIRSRKTCGKKCSKQFWAVQILLIM